MTNSPAYVLDADVFVQAYRNYYRPEVFPGFWETLCNYASRGTICSIDKVLDELIRGNDWLSDWARDEFANGFNTTDEDGIIRMYREIIQWVEAQERFFDFAKADFASAADGWLVAYASANGCTVVTQEQPAPESRNKVKLPDVCIAFDVFYIGTYEMLQRLGIRF